MVARLDVLWPLLQAVLSSRRSHRGTGSPGKCWAVMVLHNQKGEESKLLSSVSSVSGVIAYTSGFSEGCEGVMP